MRHQSKRARKKAQLKRLLVELRGGRCERCGFTSDVMGVFTFHHLGRKNFCLSGRRLGSLPMDKIMRELAGCQLLCLNCHALVHQGGPELRIFDGS